MLNRNLQGLLNKLVVFQLITVGVFYFGPIRYERPSVEGFEAGFWVLYYLLMLKVGAVIGGSYRFVGASGPKDPKKFINVCVGVSLILTPITIYSRAGSFLPTGDLGDIYGASHERRMSGDSLIEYVRMAFGYVLFGLFPLLIIYWRDLSRQLRALSIVGVALNVYMSYVMGVNKYIFDCIIIYVSQAYIVGGHLVLRSFKGWVAVVVTIVSLIFASIYFTQGQLTREGSAAISGYSPALNAYSDYNVDDGELAVFYSAISSYLTQGYRAIDLSLHEDFVFTWGVGNSTFFSRQTDRLIGTSIADHTYPARIEKYGWDRYVQWSSFYLWWASDLTYVGVGVLMLVFGFMYSSIGNTLISQRDVASVVLLAYLVIAAVYLSANNQIMQSGEGAVGFLSLLLPYLFKRRLVQIKR